MTAFGIDGTVPDRNTTEHAGFPLPPDRRPNRPPIKGGRYFLPHPVTGAPQRFTRATTVSGILDDTTQLDKWKMRNVVKGLVLQPALIGRVTTATGFAEDHVLNMVAEDASIAAGSLTDAERGTAVHAWLEYIDDGTLTIPELPEVFQPHATNYRRVLAERGVVAVPSMIERIVWHPDGYVGTLDRIYELADGTWCLGDVKTSKTLKYGYLSFAVQLAIYRDATHMLSEDCTRWEPMPVLREDFALLAHIPSNDPSTASLPTFDMRAGRAALAVATRALHMRRQADKVIPYQHATPIPSPEQAAHHAARYAVETSHTPADLQAAWEKYQAVWTDDLTQLGNAVAAALTSTTTR